MPPTSTSRPLTPKQQRFIAEYLIDLNATEAAKRAGYSPRTANEQAARLLVNLSSEIESAKTRTVIKLDVKSQQVMAACAELAFSDIRQLYGENGNLLPMKQWPDSIAKCVQSVEYETRWEGRGDDAVPVYVVKVKLWDKVGAINMLMRRFGLITTGKGHTTSDERPAANYDPSKLTPEEFGVLNKIKQKCLVAYADPGLSVHRP